MSLSEECIQYFQKELEEVKTRRGDEYDRWYGLLTAQVEYLEIIIENSESSDDEDIGWDVEDNDYYGDIGVESSIQAENWVESSENISQVLEELCECDTKEKFYNKFTTNASLAWLYFWDVKFWEETLLAYEYIIAAHDDTEGEIPQWMKDEMAEWAT